MTDNTNSFWFLDSGAQKVETAVSYPQVTSAASEDNIRVGNKRNGYQQFIACGFLVWLGLSALGCASGEKGKLNADSQGQTLAPSGSPPPGQAVDAKSTPAADSRIVKGEKSVNNSDVSTFKCSSGEDKRTVELQKTDEGCSVVYSKFSKSDTVANAKRGVEHCQKIIERITANLKDAGFNCIP